MKHELDAKGLALACSAAANAVGLDEVDEPVIEAAIRAYLGNAEPVALKCAECHGSGQVEYEVDIGPGYATQRSQCVKCKGTGHASAPPPSPSVDALVRALEGLLKLIDAPDYILREAKAIEPLGVGSIGEARAALSSVRKEAV